jgi:hypothetical protein
MRSAGAIRAFVADDIPAVAALHRRAFHNSSTTAVEDDLRDVFLANPWVDADLPSLVCDGPNGVVGFLGVVPRRLVCGGRLLRLAVSSQFMVDPAYRGRRALDLLDRFLEGPQDLSIADEASEASRQLWTALGGETALLQGLRWTKILRPFRFALSLNGHAARVTPLRSAARSLCAIPDAIAARLPGSPFAPPRARRHEAAFSTAALLSLLAVPGRLGTVYDTTSLSWLLERLRRKQCFGSLHAQIVYSANGHPIGGYLCYTRTHGTAEVAHFTAQAGGFDQVWSQLIADAWQRRASAISGRLDPRHINELSDRKCVFNRGFGALLFHTRNAEIRDAIHQGTLAVSRLDGEWWMRFIGEDGQVAGPSS